MDMSTGSSHITLLDTGEMLFLSVSRLDVGTYQCIAENRAGATRSRNATLEVACKFEYTFNNRPGVSRRTWPPLP